MYTGVRTKIVTAFILVVFFTLVAIVFGIKTSSNINSNLQEISSVNAPALIAAEELAIEGLSLTLTATELANSKNNWERLQIIDRTKDREKIMVSLIIKLNDLKVDKVLINEIVNNKKGLVKAIGSLDNIIKKRIDLEKKQKLYMNNIIKMTGLEFVTIGNSDDNNILTIKKELKLEHYFDAIIKVMLDGLRSENKYNTDLLRGSFLQLLDNLSREYKNDNLINTKKTLEIIDELRLLGEGPDNVFILAYEIENIELILRSTLENHRLDSQKLKVSLTRLINKLSNDITEISESTEKESKEKSSILVALGFLSLMIALSVATYLHYNLVRRIEKIKVSMNEIADGNLSYPIPRDGGDEIAEMAEFLRRFVGQLSTREDELRVIVNDRTQELSIANKNLKQELIDRQEIEKKLYQAQKMEALGNLAGGVAHTFNNLLQPILILSEITRDEQANGSKAKNRMNRVIEACNRAKVLGDRILLFSRQTELKKEKIDIFKVTYDAIKLLRVGLPSSISLDSDLSPSLGKVMADKVQIEALIMNLGTNAADSMSGYSGKIDISLQSEIVDGVKYAVISVSDNGSGIEEEDLSRIFDPFYTTKGVGKGTGMGLSMASGIVSAHEGLITVDSVIDKGSMFKVFIPLLDK